MSNEQKQSFFSRILKNPSSDFDDEELKDAAGFDVAKETEPEKPVLPDGRGVFTIPTHSLLHSLWKEWGLVSLEPQGDVLALVMESPDEKPVPMTDEEMEKEKQKIAAKLLMESKKRFKLIHPEKAENPDIPADVDADVLVTISRDGMGAWVFLFPPSGNGNHITHEQLQDSILAETLSYGIDTSKILQISERPPYFELILIARGLAKDTDDVIRR